MKIQVNYRANEINQCNVEITDRYLCVNCICVWPFNIPFTTDMIHGRKDYYFFYLWDGEMDVLEQGEIKLMTGGSFIIFPPNQHYFYRNSGGSGMYYCLHISGYGLENLLKECELETGRIIPIGQNHEIQRFFSEIMEIYMTRPICYEQHAGNLAERILIEIAQTRSRPEAHRPARVANSLKIIHESYNTDITIEQLAQAEFLSVSRYRTLFRQCTGQTPMEYLTALRIKTAADFIQHTTLPLKKIAAMVGYGDQLYFSRVFKKEMGQSPQEYRKEAQE